nr:MAG TPA: hypothetical protein [Caudoviricetes sp.]
MGKLFANCLFIVSIEVFGLLYLFKLLTFSQLNLTKSCYTFVL